MSNLNNLQERLVTLSKQLTAAMAEPEVNEELIWDLEDEIADINDEIEGIVQDDYNDKHAAQWR